jgi:hypothetical protein
MTLDQTLDALKDSGFSVAIRNSLYLFPMMEAVHVIALTLVFGTIMVVDLRILGIASKSRPYSRVSADMLKWTWAAFALAAFTGSLMFVTNARVYFHNGFFRAKFALMALAGLNMLVFQLTSGGRHSEPWDTAPVAPARARLAAIASLVLWALVIGMGRTVGFTTTGAAAKQAAPPAGVNFDDFLNGSGAPAASSTSPEAAPQSHPG